MNIPYIVSVLQLFCFWLLNHYFNCPIVLYVFYYILIILVYDIDVYRQQPLAMHVKEIVCKWLIPYPMVLWLYPLRIAGIWNKWWMMNKAYDTKFLGIYVDSRPTLSWKNHVEQMTYKLSAVCYAMRSVISQETLKVVYYTYVHSIMNYRIIFLGELFT